MRVGVLTGGGDCPGLNAVIRAVVRRGVTDYGYEFVGFRDGWKGPLEGLTMELGIPQVRGILPRGYPPGACEAVAPRDGASAAIRCQKNQDPGGPLSATYTLATDEEALEVMFAEVLDALAVVDCPGNIQSPVLCPTGVSKTFGEVCR